VAPKTILNSHHFPDEIEFLNKIITHVGDELMLIDKEARIVYVNKAAVKGLGYTKKYLINRRITKFFKERITLAQWKTQHFNRLKKSRRPGKFVVERVRNGKQVQTIEITAVYLKYKDKEFILSIARDVSRQISMQKAIKESEDLHRLISDGAGDGIFTADLKGRIVYVNRALEEMVKISLKVAKGKSFKNYVAPRSLPLAVKCFMRALAGQSKINENIDILDKNKNPIPVEINVSPLYKDGKIVQVHAIVRDVRDRKQFEQLSHEAEKMKALQYFISGTAGELKHPLLGVLNMTQGLLRKYRKLPFEYIGFKEFEDLLLVLENINKQVQHCYKTTERVLNLNVKKTRMQNVYSPPNDIIREIVKIKQGDIKTQGIRLNLRLGKNLAVVLISPIELSHIITNLVNNSIQAMPGGGVLTIRTARSKIGGMVDLQIVDDGVGIAKENMSHIFEPFFTTRQRGAGKNSGLGLPIVFSLIKAANGRIKVDSSLRKGTSVLISLPIRRKDPKRA